MERRNIKLNIAFDGSNYNGWQKQKNFRSVQQTIEEELEKIFQERIILIGAGRTDRGAHALNYTANFHTHNFNIPVENLPKILNSLLPEDIKVLSAIEVPSSFHSRFSAKAREYIYLILNEKECLPHFRNYVYHLPLEVDLGKIKEICQIIRGRHNFKSFCYGYRKDEKKDFQRIIYYFRPLEIKFLNQHFILFFIKGNGFLKGMIRSLISVCLNYEQGKIKKENIISALNGETIIDSKLRVAVPASGLYYKRTFF
jgi:tRNA pseudouridine38-40 synthase